MKTNHHKFCMALLAVTVLAAGAASQAWGASYKAIDLTPSGFDGSVANGTNGTQQVGFGWGSATGGNTTHALLWNGSANSFIDLNPSGFAYSEAHGISGTQQVGFGNGAATGSYADGEFYNHALLWNGSAASYVDLNPSGFNWSYALGTSGTQQVGGGYGSATGGNYHALLWNGSADSFIDLNPSGFAYSEALGISGTQQVGWGNGHALLWNGSAASYVDLNPSGFDESLALGINGTQQVGWGYGPATGGEDDHAALLWSGTAASCVDLNPGGFIGSEAWGTNGTQQVGWGSPTVYGRVALLWNGNADSYIDLSQFLPTGLTYSWAQAIDSSGNIVGFAVDSSGNEHAILWQPVPEPATFLLLGLGGLMLRKRRA
jgi:hypothetical protein